MAVAKQRIHYDQWSATVSTNTFTTVRTYQIAPDSVTRLDFTVLGMQSDEAQRAMFRRVMLVYRINSGVVVIQGPQWETLETIKSNVNMDVRYVLGTNTVTLQIRNASATATRWKGYTDRLDLK